MPSMCKKRKNEGVLRKGITWLDPQTEIVFKWLNRRMERLEARTSLRTHQYHQTITVGKPGLADCQETIREIVFSLK